MGARIGRIIAQLAEPVTRVSPELSDHINRNVNPPSAVGPDDVYVRAMFVVSDQVNSFGGRFPADEHQRLVDLLVDSPVLVGHRKDKLPVGRTFHAETVDREGASWVKSYFYWLRSARGADSLRENIDGGIYKECSIGFTFSFAECSMCGKDIRLCEHEPFESYATPSGDHVCHFNYRQIERVLETSLVYRGATPDTSISTSLSASTTDSTRRPVPDLLPVSSREDLPEAEKYLLIPHYESIPVSITVTDRACKLRLPEPTEFDLSDLENGIRDLLSSPVDSPVMLSGRLVGMRGKQRLSVDYLNRYLSGEQSPVQRVLLFLLPHPALEHRCPGTPGSNEPLRFIPYRTGSRAELMQLAAEITTRSGVEVLPAGQVTRYHLSASTESPSGQSYRLILPATSRHASLCLTAESGPVHLQLRQFHLARLLKGSRFVADPIEPSVPGLSSAPRLSGRVEAMTARGKSQVLTLSGALKGLFCLRPIVLEGQKRLLFYKIDNLSSTDGGGHV